GISPGFGNKPMTARGLPLSSTTTNWPALRTFVPRSIKAVLVNPPTNPKIRARRKTTKYFMDAALLFPELKPLAGLAAIFITGRESVGPSALGGVATERFVGPRNQRI